MKLTTELAIDKASASDILVDRSKCTDRGT